MNTNNVIAIINVLGQLVGTLGPIGLDLALKIKQLFEQNKVGSVDIKAIGDETIKINDDTIASVNAWLVEHGYDPLPTV